MEHHHNIKSNSKAEASSKHKTYVIKATLPCQGVITKALAQAGPAPTVCLGLDVELAGAAGALTIGGATPLDLGKHSRESWTALCVWLLGLGCKVHVAQEACGFGWEFHRKLAATGAGSLVVAPEVLNGKRKTDQRDARQLSQALWDFIATGNKTRLRPVRVPSPEEHRCRALSRHRAQLRETRVRLDAQGRAMMRDHDFHAVPADWWRPLVWKKLQRTLTEQHQEWLLALVEPLQQLLRQQEERIKALDEQILRHAAMVNKTVPTPKGLGEPTRVQIGSEVQQWSRFANRGQAGSFIGCSPSEHSSGTKQRLGSIDRQGSKRIRTMLVEAVWRLKVWNRHWRGFVKFPAVLAGKGQVGPAQKKKAVIACARLLMIDLWRLETGKATLEGLGLVPQEALPATGAQAG